ncbi:MAG: KH domain-containing protein [Akkermansiaceae bacterium]
MPNHVSKFTKSLKRLGEIQVTEWDFMDLLNKDVSELKISRSLKRLGNIRVMEWDFRTVMPAVNKLANQEVDLVDMIKRTAHYKVIEWDFRSALPPAPSASGSKGLTAEEMQGLMLRLKNFLQYVAVNLTDEPSRAQIKVQEIAPNVLRFRLILVKRDVALLIGHGGHTAAAIRALLKTAAGTSGVHALLVICSHEEDIKLGGGGRLGELG